MAYPHREIRQPLTVFTRIWSVVRRIPRGRAISYGGVADLAGLRGGARTVGWAMASLPNDRAAPWWRVVRADGTIAPRPSANEQQRRLRAEGVRFSARGRVDLARYGWPSLKRERVRVGQSRAARAGRTTAPAR